MYVLIHLASFSTTLVSTEQLTTDMRQCLTYPRVFCLSFLVQIVLEQVVMATEDLQKPITSDLKEVKLNKKYA